MSFGAEFRKMRENGGSLKLTEDAAKEAESAASKKDAETPVVEDPDAEIVEQALKDAAVETEEKKEEIVIPPPHKKVPIKIKGKTFETVEEAMAFAEAEFNEAEKKEAYAKGVIDSTKQPEPVKPAEKKEILRIAEKLFENPDEAMEDLDVYIQKVIDRRAEARDAVKTEAQLKIEAQTKAVNEFYKTNADLVDWQDEVNMVVDRNLTYLKTLPEDKLAEEAARLSREYINSVKEKALPRTTLNSKPAITPAGGTKSTTTTKKEATENKVSFAQQVRSTNKRTVMQDEG